MSETNAYVPPKVWTWTKPNGGQFANINRPIAGPTHEKALPVGRHPLQLYSLATPNGQKVTIMLEELLALGFAGAEYDAWPIDIGEGDQFGSGFVAINPNSKIPAMVDRSGPEPIRVFESGAILTLSRGEIRRADAERAAARARSACRGSSGRWAARPSSAAASATSTPMRRSKIEYAIDRYAMETKRLLDVLDRRLGESRYLAGDAYTIADIAAFPWMGGLVEGTLYNAAEFLSVQDYKNVRRWVDDLLQRPAVKRGRMVNRTSGDPAGQLRERHDASDFDTKTQDKLDSAAAR